MTGTRRPPKYPDEVGGNIPNRGKLGGDGGKLGEMGGNKGQMRGKWEEMGGDGVLWGEVGASNKKCGARVD